MKTRILFLFVLIVSLALTPGVAGALAQEPEPGGIESPVAAQQQAQNVELVSQIGGAIEAIAVQGNYAYVGIGHRLVIFDVSSPATPKVVGKTLPFPNVVTSVAISGSHAFVTAYQLGGLRVIDISNPTNPIEVGAYIPAPVPPTIPMCQDVAVSGSYAYLAAVEYGVYVIDVSNVATPVEVAHYKESGLAAMHVVHSAGYLYIASGDPGRGLYIIDVTNPLNPSKVGFYGISEYPSGMGLRGIHVYMTESHCGGGSLRVIDVSQPNNPVEVSQVSVAGGKDVAISDSFAYVAVRSGLQVVNISNPATPTVVGSLSTSDYARHVAASSSHVYLTHDFADLRIIDTSNPARPTEVGYYKTPGYVYDVAISDHYVYIVGTEGLHVFDITHPVSPIEVGHLSVYYHRLDISGSYAYATSGGLRVIDISNPAQPTEVGSWSGSARDVAAAGDYAYVADESNGLRIISVADPTHPVEVGSYDTPGWATGVAVVGDYAYVSDSDSLRIISVSDPTHPTEVGSLAVSSPCWDVTVSGFHAYVATTRCSSGRHILEVIEISNPAHPILVGHGPGGGWGIAVSGSYAYAADATNGLRIVNISNPSSPTEVGFYETPGLAKQVAVSGKYVYVANDADGLIILRHLPLSSITGRVLDGGGDPIEGVQIAAGAEYSSTTDVSGQYTITDVLPGDYTLTPTKAGCLFTPASRTVSVPPDATGQDFEGQCEFDISGRVLDGSDSPFAGVQISAGAGRTATTGTDGQYIFTKLLSGTYTLTPTLVGYTFQPTTRTVTLPPDATGQNFVILPVPVSVTLSLSGTASLPANLTYTDTQGLTTTLYFPTGAVTATTTLILTPTLAQGDAGFAFAGHAFEIGAFQGGHLLSGLTFSKPVTISICYSGQDVRVVSDESQLVLQWWTGNGWEDAANTCDPPSTYDRDLANQVLGVPICHLSRFGLFGPTRQVYLPLILRSY